ncbi:hypothetical protein GCM10028807_22960 [Spirosoma daeguense]
MSKGVKFLLILLTLSGVSWAVYECKYYVSYYSDLKDRPWAYSQDENAKLLVGTWQGEFRDPDNVAKTIRLTIVEPMTDEERSKKAGKRTRKRSGLGSRSDKKHFDGLATVTSQRGQEDYEFDGHVKTEDGHKLNVVHFQTKDETRQLRNNFKILSGLEGGTWQDDNLTLIFTFSFITNTGSGYSTSSDPRYDKKITVHFSRVQ